MTNAFSNATLGHHIMQRSERMTVACWCVLHVKSLLLTPRLQLVMIHAGRLATINWPNYWQCGNGGKQCASKRGDNHHVPTSNVHTDGLRVCGIAYLSGGMTMVWKAIFAYTIRPLQPARESVLGVAMHGPTCQHSRGIVSKSWTTHSGCAMPSTRFRRNTTTSN